MVPKTPSGGMKNNHDHKQKHMTHCITVTVTAALCSFPETKHFLSVIISKSIYEDTNMKYQTNMDTKTFDGISRF